MTLEVIVFPSFRTTALLVASVLPPALACAHTPTDLSRPFDRYSWVTTHNAFTSNGLIPNQSQTIAEQLDAGVRAFMLDLHSDDGRVRLCHNQCTGTPQPFAELVNDTLIPFLDRDPNAILTLQLEDFTDPGDLIAELDEVPGLVGRTFDPSTWSTAGWPTYEEMVKSGQRVVIFSLNRERAGTIVTHAGGIHIMPSEDFTVENHWSLGMTIWQHDYSCQSRWGESTLPLARPEIPGKPGWRPLFTMNQFHGMALAYHAARDNDFDRLRSRYLEYCRPVAGRKPNYVAVDFHERGDVAKFVDWLNIAAPDYVR